MNTVIKGTRKINRGVLNIQEGVKVEEKLTQILVSDGGTGKIIWQCVVMIIMGGMEEK